jgi:hypothetical protein
LESCFTHFPRCSCHAAVTSIAVDPAHYVQITSSFTCACEARVNVCREMDQATPPITWSSLPDDTVEVILSYLSLVELMCIFMTCRRFYAAYRRKLSVEHKSLSALGENAWGRARIKSIATLVAHFLEGKRLHQDFPNCEWNPYFVLADGVLHGDPSLGDHGWGFLPPFEALFNAPGVRLIGVSLACLWSPYGGSYDHDPPLDNLLIRPLNELSATLTMVVSRISKEVTIEVLSVSEAGLEGVALLLALLSGGMAQWICDTGHHGVILIRPSLDADYFPAAGLHAQMAPLLPFASRYATRDGITPGFELNGERMDIGRVVSAGDASTASVLWETRAVHAALQPIVKDKWFTKLVRQCKLLSSRLRCRDRG